MYIYIYVYLHNNILYCKLLCIVLYYIHLTNRNRDPTITADMLLKYEILEGLGS